MYSEQNIIIVGAGGHSKIVLSTLLASGKTVAGFVDDNPALWGAYICGYKVLGAISVLAHYADQAAILAIGENKTRKILANTYNKLNWISAIHPAACIHESVKIGRGSLVCAGSIVQPDSIIGDHVIVNTASSVDHDCIVQDFVHIAPGARLAGNVTVNEGCCVGMNSCAINGVSIGRWTTIGAGSVIIKSIEEKAYAKGVPACVYKYNEVEI